MPSKPCTVVLAKLGKVRKSGDGWSARCPVENNHQHGDKNPSLSVSEGADGRALVTCHKGCELDDITRSLGLDVAALFEEEPPEQVVIAEYPYTDAEGTLLYVKERLFPKSFRQRRPDGKGGWDWKLGRVQRPLYRLPKVEQAKAEGTRVYYVEGERDVHTLEAHGLVATTAGGVKDFRESHAATLKGADLVIVADNDTEGRKLAQAVSAATGAPILVSDRAKDVTEHLNASGTLDDLVPLTDPPALEVIEGGRTEALDLCLGVRIGDSVVGESTVPELGDVAFEATYLRRDRYGVHAETAISVKGTPIRQSMVNLSKHEDRTKLANAAADRLGDKALAKPILLRLDHFAMNVWEWWTQASGPELVVGGGFSPPEFLLEPYIVRGGITMLYGPPKSGKSYVGLLMALALTHGRNSWAVGETTSPCVFVNLERPPDTVGYRLQRLAAAVGVPASLVIQHEKGRKFTDVAPSTIRWLRSNPGACVIVDSLSRMGAGDLNSNEDTNRAMDMLHSLNASVVVLAHTPRSDASHVFGSVMHDAAADVLVRCEKAKSDKPGLMGVRVTVDDGNDVGWAPPRTWALEFEQPTGLVAVRDAREGDFPDLSDVRPVRERVREFLLMSGDSTAAQIAEGLDISTDSASKALRREPETFMTAWQGGGRGKATVWTLSPTRHEETRTTDSGGR